MIKRSTKTKTDTFQNDFRVKISWAWRKVNHPTTTHCALLVNRSTLVGQVPTDSLIRIPFTQIDYNLHHLIKSAEKSNRAKQKEPETYCSNLKRITQRFLGNGGSEWSVYIISVKGPAAWGSKCPTASIAISHHHLACCSLITKLLFTNSGVYMQHLSFPISIVNKSSFSQYGAWQTSMTHHSVLLLTCLFPPQRHLYQSRFEWSIFNDGRSRKTNESTIWSSGRGTVSPLFTGLQQLPWSVSPKFGKGWK